MLLAAQAQVGARGGARAPRVAAVTHAAFWERCVRPEAGVAAPALHRWLLEAYALCGRDGRDPLPPVTPGAAVQAAARARAFVVAAARAVGLAPPWPLAGPGAARAGAPAGTWAWAADALLVGVLRRAARVVGGTEGRLVLAPDPAWAALVPVAPGAPAAGYVMLGAYAPLRRGTLRAGGATAHVLATGQRVVAADLTRPGPFGTYAWVAPHLLRAGVRAFAMVPLRAGGRITGSLSVNFVRPLEPERPTPAEWAALEGGAARAAAALERLRRPAARPSHPSRPPAARRTVEGTGHPGR